MNSDSTSSMVRSEGFIFQYATPIILFVSVSTALKMDADGNSRVLSRSRARQEKLSSEGGLVYINGSKGLKAR